MTEKQEAEGKLESLSDRIWQRLISVIPFLLLSSVIAFWVFKFLYEKFGSNSLGAVILVIITISGIASFISITAGYIYKNRQLGCTLAVLIPVVVSMEAAIQFGRPLVDMLIIMYMVLFLAVFVYTFVDNMLLPLVNTDNIKKEDIVSIQIFSPIADVARLVGEVLRYLTVFKVKTTIADNERQWKLRSRNYPHYYYLCARSDNDNSVNLGFLGFTERSNNLCQSEQNEKDLNFLRETIVGYLRLHNINYKSKENPSLSSDILKVARREYEGVINIGELKDAKKSLINNLKSYKYVMITVFLIVFMVYLGRQSISQLSEQYPLLFLATISIISVLIGAFAKDLLQFLKVGGKNEREK
ncbi:MAG: hypothetical protein KAT65_08230 [Methanophagales archaeon]|nr:hypothetical protein [Methanophagales archaeon]